MNIHDEVDTLAALLENELKEQLTGIYLHGSLAMGGFHPEHSDIDVLVVVKRKLTQEEKKRIARGLLAFEERLPGGGGVELSVITASSMEHWKHPASFEFHYSAAHRDRYRADENYICGGGTDPDLAAHLTVTYHRGIALYGPPVRSVVPEIPREHYMDSIFSDIENATEQIAAKPVYYTLNLCRVLYYLREGIVSSKVEGGAWGLSVLPPEYRPLIRQCLDEYSGLKQQPSAQNSRLAEEFAGYMCTAIHREAGSSGSSKI
ncbi:streptomycin 3'-adenylyltransferase [Paenibacillus mucilaginosus]|uniref:aminoglycoside adenylyltransferase domain-containing protein n=1 Tax=Paenibacillus mucilaginosus TaxID=61624 RepID=UPI003D1B4A13